MRKRYAIAFVMYRLAGGRPETVLAAVDATSVNEAVGLAATIVWKHRPGASLTDPAVMDMSVEPPASALSDDVIQP